MPELARLLGGHELVTTAAPRRRVAPAITIILAVCLLAAGTLVGLLLTPTAVPAGLASGQDPTTATVTRQQFDDAQSVSVSLNLSGTRQVDSATNGIITALNCTPGSQLTSGTPIFSANGIPVIALATSVPLWRDIAAGDHGADVSALQKELNRLGYHVSTNGYYHWQTRAAVADLLSKAGGSLPPGGTLTRSAVTWIPETPAIVAACGVRMGQQVSEGTPIATLPARLKSISITKLLAKPIAGDRVLDFGQFVVPTTTGGTIVDAATLKTLSNSSLYPSLLDQQKAQGLTVDWKLKDPITVAAIPPRAIYGQNGTSACVESDGTPRHITVTSSSLGQSLVAFDGGSVPATVSLNPTHRSCT